MTLQTCDESLFWYYISERHRIYLKRQNGDPKPWTKDPILRDYKFVNVFRPLDRTTKWLINNFLWREEDPALLAFNICWFRCFNRWETGQLLGWQADWNPEAVLKKLRTADSPVFTGAYIIHSEPGEPKDASMVEVCTALRVICDDLFGPLSDPQEYMQNVWKDLQHARHIGQFMAYQMVLDMMYCPPLLYHAKDRDSWTCTGPGALRGLKRLDPAATMRDSLSQMQNLTERSRWELRRDPHVPELSLHDIEFCLCELDKYCRVKFGEGHPRSKYPGAA